MRRSGVTLLAAVAREPAEVRASRRASSQHRASAFPIRLPNNKLTAHWLVDTPLPAAWIRAPGRMQNTFGNESFLDEIAAAANVEPFEIRMRYLNDARGLELLERLRQFARWEPRGAQSARHWRIRARAGRVLCEVRAGAHLRGRGGRRDGRTQEWPDQGRSRVRRARLRTDHQSRWSAQSDRRQCRADGEPQRCREADVQPQRGYQPQLGQLPDPDLSQRARSLRSI